MCSSTCTCSAIHHPAGDRGYSGEDRICNWRPIRAHQKAAYGSIVHPIRVNLGRKYNTISTVCKCESCLFFIKPFCWEIFLVCDSRANQALAQARPIDALHLTSIVSSSAKASTVNRACSLAALVVLRLWTALAKRD